MYRHLQVQAEWADSHGSILFDSSVVCILRTLSIFFGYFPLWSFASRDDVQLFGTLVGHLYAGRDKSHFGIGLFCSDLGQCYHVRLGSLAQDSVQGDLEVWIYNGTLFRITLSSTSCPRELVSHRRVPRGMFTARASQCLASSLCSGKLEPLCRWTSMDSKSF